MKPILSKHKYYILLAICLFCSGMVSWDFYNKESSDKIENRIKTKILSEITLDFEPSFATQGCEGMSSNYNLNFDTKLKTGRIDCMTLGSNTDSIVVHDASGKWLRLITPISTQLAPYALTSSLSAVATSGTFASLTSKPTTLSGYGIADGYSTSNPSNYITLAAARSGLSLTTTASGSATYNSSTGAFNIPKVPIYYNASGVINQQMKIWTDVVTGSVASGQSINITSASFGTILGVQISAAENVATEKGAILSIKTNGTSAIVVNMYRSKNTGVLIGGNVEGLEFHPSPASVSYRVTVIGY